MVIVDIIPEHFPELYPEIAARRKTDAILDEICSDLEDLTQATKLPDETTTDNQLQSDLRATVRALEDEIRKRLGQPIY